MASLRKKKKTTITLLPSKRDAIAGRKNSKSDGIPPEEKRKQQQHSYSQKGMQSLAEKTKSETSLFRPNTTPHKLAFFF